MNRFLALKPEKEKELLQKAQPIVKIILAINGLQKKIAEKEKEIKDKPTTATDLEKLKSELEKKNQELAEMDQEEVRQGINAIRFLLNYNQNLVKYIVKGYSSLKGKMDLEELTSEGISSLLKAIEKFDLNSKYRFATYAGYWVKQYIQSYIHKQQFINQGAGVKDRKNVIYYDSGYQNDDHESKTYSLLETLHDEETAELTAEEMRHRDVSIQTNDLINALGKRESILLVRLFYKIKPSNLVDIYWVAKKEEKKELRENLKLRDEFDLELLKKYSLESPKIRNLPVAKKYLSYFTKTHKFIEISRIIEKSENTTRQLKLKTFQELQKLAKERKLHFLMA